ncbi:MAG: D-alanyl-D-alanine carboxypeptidase family protein [Desulfatiglandaceae bacterium]
MTEPWRRDVEMNHLHPVCRERVQGVLDACAREGIPFRMFEGYRSPHRQQYLYEQGRTRPGAIVTHAGPWTSIHQYGLAADFVLFENGGWSWDTSGSKEDWWSRLHEIGREYGLEPLSWEMPHLQMSRVSLSDLKAGQYPGGGDLSWAECLESAIVVWTGVPASPAVPDLVPERPPLDPGAAGPALPEFVPPPAADWHNRFGGREWRYDSDGVYIQDYYGGRRPLRTPGEPSTCRKIWEIYGPSIVTACDRFHFSPALIMMTIATETAFARKADFTGPLTFRWEPHVEVKDVNPPRLGDYSVGPMQVLATTARWIVRVQGLDYEPFVVAPALEYRIDEPDRLPLYEPDISVMIGTAAIARRRSRTGDDPILVSAAYNAGGVYKSSKNPWCLRTYGDHLDRAAKWYGDACAVLKENA